MAHIGQSQPDSALGFEVKALEHFSSGSRFARKQPYQTGGVNVVLWSIQRFYALALVKNWTARPAITM